MPIKKTYICLSLVILLLAGCSAAFVPYTNDPLKKIEWTLHLTSVDRPLVSRRFLLGVKDQIDKNDKDIMAHFNRAVAYMISSKEYQRYRAYYKTEWISDIDGDSFEAEELYLSAISMFTELNLYYEASNTSWLLSKLYKQLSRYNQQCLAIHNSKKYHFIGKHNDPEKAEGVILDKKGTPFDVFLDNLLKENNCKNIL